MSGAGKDPVEADDGQCDSGIESLRSLRSLPEPGPAAPGAAKEDAEGERADSAYGSASFTEPLPLPRVPEPEPPGPVSPLSPTGPLSAQQLEALTYISEDGDT